MSFSNPTKFKTEIDLLPKLLESNETLEANSVERIKQNILTSAANFNPQISLNFFQQLKFAARERGENVLRQVTAVLVGLSLIGGTAFASSSAVPGGTLYPFKRIKEKIELAVTFSDEARANLQAIFASERIRELETMEANADPADKTIQTQAKNDASVQVSNAISTLTEVHTKLLLKGNNDSAAAVATNIEKLKAQAKAKQIFEVK